MSEAPQRPARPVLITGASLGEICGVRDYAEVTSRFLGDLRWAWWRPVPRGSPFGRLQAVLGWLRVVRRPDSKAVLWHYSSPSYGPHGLPLLVPLWLLALRSGGRPMVTYLHELTYPWGRRGWKGTVLAASQRLALLAVCACSERLLVTTEDRASWLRSRRWIPSREVEIVPVTSNAGEARPQAHRSVEPATVGLLAFGAEGTNLPLVVAAWQELCRTDEVCLVLIGFPGSDSPQGARWRTAAADAGLNGLIRFTGTLPVGQLAAAISGVDACVFADEAGPTARKTSLAACLAYGHAVVATSGPDQWPALVDSAAVMLVEPTPSALAGAVRHVLTDRDLLNDLSAKASAFYREHMAAAVVGGHLARALDEAGGGALR